MARFEGSITLTSMGYQESDYGKICGAVIGRGGSGIKALTAKFPGLFVMVYNSRLGKDARTAPRDCDSIHISGRSQGDVQEAALCISDIAKDTMDGIHHEDKGPKSTATCPSAAVGAVIGRGGSGLKTIQEKAGDRCHVHYSRESGLFEISASTQTACDRAKIYIGNAIKMFFQPKEQERPESRLSSSSGGFSALPVDYGSDSEDELVTAVGNHKTSVEKTVIAARNALDSGSRSDVRSIHSRTKGEPSPKERWAIREELGEMIDGETGKPLYPAFNCQYRGWVQGKLAVPWSAVDEVIAKRRGKENKAAEDREYKRAKLHDTKSREQQRQTVVNGLGNDSLFPLLSSGRKSTVPIGWGTKPSSVSSGDGVDELNKTAHHRYVVPNRLRKTNGSTGTGPVDLTGMMPSAPHREMLDLSKMLLPTGPKLSRRVPQQPVISQDEEYWLDVHLDQGGTEEDYYALLQEEMDVGGGSDGEDWWNN